MKKLTLVVVLLSLAVIMLPGCGKTNPNEIQISANSTFTLPVGKTAVLKGKDLSFKFESVSADSRCPTGVQCVWAGEAKCNLSVTQGGQTKTLVLTQSGSSEGTLQEFAAGYKVSFLLNPYPKADIQINPQDYALTMKLY